MYASVCHTRRFLEVGMLCERYFPGSGEDYDYSCRASMLGYRSVGTTLSYVFHHWSQTFKAMQDEDDVKSLMIPELNWNHNHEKWGPEFDIWGYKCSICKTNMRCPKDNPKIAVCPKHPDEIYQMPESTIVPL
jgi:GT2 family glycosyltransferase